MDVETRIVSQVGSSVFLESYRNDERLVDITIQAEATVDDDGTSRNDNLVYVI